MDCNTKNMLDKNNKLFFVYKSQLQFAANPY